MYSFLSISFYFSLVQKNLPNHLTAEIKISLWDLVIVYLVIENGKIFYKISLCVQKNVKVKNNKVLRDISSPNTKEFVIHEIIVNI